jgi:hypothetical protein
MVSDEVFVPRHVDHPGRFRITQVQGREIEIDRDAASTFFRETVHGAPCQGFHQLALAVIDVPCGADDHA